MTSTKKPSHNIFRKEAFILIGFLILLVGIYFSLFFTWHLKWVSQKALTKIYGAEVNIGSLQVSYLNPGISFKNLQFTNHQKPSHNLFELGEVSLQLNSKDLMFASIVAEQARITNVRIDRKRKRIGYVSPDSQKLISLSLDLKKNKKAVLDKKSDGNILENAISFSKNKDLNSELKNILKNLNTDAISKKYLKRVEDQEQVLKAYKNSLSEEEIKRLESQIKTLKDKVNSKANPVEILALGKNLLSDIKNKKDKVSKLNVELKSELSKLKNIKSDFKEDLKNLKSEVKNKFKIPDISPKSLAQDFFAETISTRFYLFKYWLNQIRKNSEAKIQQTTSKVLTKSQSELVTTKVKQTLEASKEEKAIKQTIAKTKKRTSQYIHFGTLKRPKFWIKKVLITGEAKKNQDLQNFKGEILNISSDQFLIQKPIEVRFQGDLPKDNIYNLKVIAKLNHHIKDLNEVFDVTATYPISSFKVIDDNSLKVHLKKATANTIIKGKTLANKVEDMKITNFLNKADFEFFSSKADIKMWLEPIFSNISNFNIDILLNGPLQNPNIKIVSSLADQISNGLKKQISSQLSDFNAKIDEKISEQTEALQTKVFSKLGDQEKLISKIVGDLNLKLDSQDAAVKGALQKNSSSKLDKLTEKVGSKLTDKLFGK